MKKTPRLTAELREKINKASELKQARKFDEALKLYDEAAGFLIREAVDYAHTAGGSEGKGNSGKMSPKELDMVIEYLRRDDLMAKISDSIAVICAEVGNRKKTEEYFEETVSFTSKS